MERADDGLARPGWDSRPPGGKAILSDGRLALFATSDPETELFGIGGKAYRMERG